MILKIYLKIILNINTLLDTTVYQENLVQIVYSIKKI